MNEEWGPLAGLIGEWQGRGGLDNSFSHSRGKVWQTPYLEKVTMKPFGPVENGTQSLFGLDYKTAMWRDDEENPFHTELGYWLWDAATGEVLRAFVVPRGIAVLAGGRTTADAKEFTMNAEIGSKTYAIGENTYLGRHASTVAYIVTVKIEGPDSWSYTENTSLRMDQFPDIFPHTDGNTLHRVA
ncbi:MAG: heme-binding beta-barrel domain-containing protein [Actinomycetota bacterium]